jgi:hypothetical protein
MAISKHKTPIYVISLTSDANFIQSAQPVQAPF